MKVESGPRYGEEGNRKIFRFIMIIISHGTHNMRASELVLHRSHTQGV